MKTNIPELDNAITFRGLSLIGGPSACGKTFLCAKIAKEMKLSGQNPLLLHHVRSLFFDKKCGFNCLAVDNEEDIFKVIADPGKHDCLIFDDIHLFSGISINAIKEKMSYSFGSYRPIIMTCRTDSILLEHFIFNNILIIRKEIPGIEYSGMILDIIKNEYKEMRDSVKFSFKLFDLVKEFLADWQELNPESGKKKFNPKRLLEI